MSEEMKETMQAEETSQAQAEEAAGTETTETMADYEEHFDDANPWNRVAEYMEKKTVLPVKVEGVVNGGVIAMVEGLRGFVPASKLSLSYIEDLETYLLKDIEVQVERFRTSENPQARFEGMAESQDQHEEKSQGHSQGTDTALCQKKKRKRLCLFPGHLSSGRTRIFFHV